MAKRRKRARVVLFQDKAGEWRWHLKARNGRILADSAEGFCSRYGAQRNLALVVREFNPQLALPL